MRILKRTLATVLLLLAWTAAVTSLALPPLVNLSGYIRLANSTPVPNIIVDLSNGQKATTDVNGKYSFSSLQKGKYVVTPEVTATYTFNPMSWNVNLQNTKANINFTAVPAATPTPTPTPTPGPTPTPTPVAPSALTATAVSPSQINLAWTDNADNEDGFKVEQCAGASCSNFVQITTVGANLTAYNATGLAESTSYSYRVRAYNAGGDSAYTSTATATTQAATSNPCDFYAAPSGIAGGSGGINSPWTLAYASGGGGGLVTAGKTVCLRGGIYRYNSVTFAAGGSSSTVMTVFRNYPDERPIITSATDTPPNIFTADYQRLDGLWIGGTKQTSDLSGIFTGSSPISHWRQMVNCTIFGYFGAVKASETEYALFQGNRFVHNGGGTLYHAIYISSNEPFPGPAGTATQHVIVDNNIFIAGAGDGGYAVHYFHNNRTGIVSRNFMTGAAGIVMDGAEELCVNNFLWKSGLANGSTTIEALDWLYIVTHGYAINNLLGPNDALMNPNTGGNTNFVKLNAFELTANNSYNKGLNPIDLTAGQEASQIGISAASLDAAIAALKTSFSAGVSSILTDATIETNFATIKNITVPQASPLYQTGMPWFDVNPINIGPNSGAPATIADFWIAFRALGLKEYDANGNVIP